MQNIEVHLRFKIAKKACFLPQFFVVARFYYSTFFLFQQFSQSGPICSSE